MKLFLVIVVLNTAILYSQDLYIIPDDVQTSWVTFENPKGEKGKGGRENKGAKGHPADIIAPSESKVLFNVQGTGIINRIWVTIDDRSPKMLRSLKLEFYWENESKPAVSVPFGDFFGMGLGRTIPFQNALFSNPEGRSFNCNIPMPFKTAAKIILTNESDKRITIFYDVNFLRVKEHSANMLYFHATWNQNTKTKLGEDFEILQKVNGKGRFLGCNLGINTDSIYGSSWWGEGEVKIYLDGDDELPSLVGTGTEDYIGTAWGQGSFVNQFQGCPIADEKNRQWTFYRYHIPDPVFFISDCRVVIQQMGGHGTQEVRKMVKSGAELIPVTISNDKGMLKLFEMENPPKITDQDFPEGWTNFYRLDNYSAAAYFYLDKPVSNLPDLAPLNERLVGLLQN